MKTPTLPHVGLPAEELLKLQGRALEACTAPGTYHGHDRHGMLVTWHYPDCDVRLHYRNGCYRIAAIEPREATE